MKFISLFGLILFFASQISIAQTFEPIPLPFKEIISDGSMHVSDYDNDGDQDVVITGLIEHLFEDDVTNGGVGFVGIYENIGGEFTFLENLSLIELWSSDVAFGDFDNDLDMDLIVSGKPTGPATSNNRELRVYENLGERSFDEIPVSINAISAGDINLIDFNNDDLIDIAITGGIESESGSVGFTDVYINKGDFNFTKLNLPVSQLSGSSEINFIDLENDGDYDIILTGFDESDFQHKTLFYEQTVDSFVLIDLGLPNLSAAAIGIADLDGNGFDDIVLTGGSDTEPYNNVLFIYFNNEGILTLKESGIPGTEDGDLDFADFDIDGDLDILLSGSSGPDINDPSITQIIVNEHGESFTLFDIEEELSGSFRGGVKWGDFDGDMDIDILKIQGGPILYKQNFDPLIVGVDSTFNTKKNQSFELSLNDLSVKDVDNKFPEDFSLNIYEGENYKIDGSSITSIGDVRTLSVPVSVSDGENTSDPFELVIDIENLLSLNKSSDIFQLYPIPVTDHLNIQSTSGSQTPYYVMVFDINGQLVLDVQKNQNHLIDFSTLKSGTYMIYLISRENLTIRKIIKE